jgi:uncharacterized membrane protein YeiH
MPVSLLQLVLDLTGTFAFALNGGMTAVRSARLDLVGVLVLGMMTALGGGIVRDVLIGDVPPETFNDWRYLTVAAGGALIAFMLARPLQRAAMPIEILDAVGLSFFCVTGAVKALDLGLGVGQAVILGTITAVGGGTLRDIMLGKVPTVLTSGLYAVPATIGAAITVITRHMEFHGIPAAVAAAVACFLVRLAGIRFHLNAPPAPVVDDK